MHFRSAWHATYLVLLGIAVTSPVGASTQAEHFNLVYIMADDLGKEWVSSYGADDIETPNIDALAETGMKFNNFYCMPQCTPTRTSLLTGQYPYRHGWVNHWDVPRWGGGCSFDPQLNPSFPTVLRDAGYVTAAAGKWQIDDFRVEPNAMHDAGLDAYCMWTGYEHGNRPSAKRYQDPYVYKDGEAESKMGAFGPDVYTDHLVEFIGENKDKPMMIYFPMALPHGPLVATPDEPEADSKLDKHKAMVRYIDKLVGRVVAAIEENGLRRNTIVIFTTDNGTSREITGTRNGTELQGGKAKTTESGINVPFIASCPGRIAEGVDSNALVDITDIAPTFCEIAGVEALDERYDGKSFLAVLDGRSRTSERQWILAMGGGNRAKLTDAGVENEYWFRDRVLRNERYKAFIGPDRKLVKLVDLASSKPDLDIQDSRAADVRSAKKLFLEAVAEMPEKDADPIYRPLDHRDWYVLATAETKVWKIGYPDSSSR